MVRQTLGPRIWMAAALLLAALAAFAPVGGAGAQTEQASITLYKAVCPAGYTGTDYYADCAANAGSGYSFTLSGPGYAGTPTKVTSGSGFTFFEGIAADGTYTLIESFPANIVDYAVFCAEGETGAPFPVTVVADGISLNLTTANDLRCDWFNVPSGPANNDQASVTIYKAVCPPEYAGTAYFDDCYGTPGNGYVFDMAGPGFAGSDTTEGGFAVFAGITAAGTYTVLETPTVPLAGYVVNCTEGGRSFPFSYVEGGIELTLGVNDDVRCDWYNLPADNDLASVTIYKAVCTAKEAADDDFDDCDDWPGVDIDFALDGPGDSVDATTGDDGFVYFDGIDVAGTYTITEDFPDDVEDYVVSCSEAGVAVEVTDAEGGISLQLALDDDLRCDWYNILEAGAAAPTPTPKPSGGTTGGTTGGVSTLPRAGTGVGEAGLPLGRFTWALAFAGLAAVAVLGTRLRSQSGGGIHH